jgi:hypothetical protein
MTDAIGGFLLDALTAVINALVVALAAVLTGLLALLPSLPSAPSVGGQWIGWLNWIVPVGSLLGILSAFVVIWVSFLLLRVGLKWVRAL